MISKVDKVLEEVKKLRGKKKDTLKQHPHIVESRQHWDWEQSYCTLKRIREKRSERLWALKGRRPSVDGRVIYPSLSTPSFTGVKFRSRGCTVLVGGVTADSQGCGQRHRLSGAREGFVQGIGN